MVEEGAEQAEEILRALDPERAEATIVGITGPPGTGKSTLVDQLIAFYRRRGDRIGVVAVDPSSPVSGGAVLGDRVRMMRHATDRDVVIRSMASRGRIGGLCASAAAAVRIVACSGCRPVLIETVGVGQTDRDVAGLADVVVLVLAPGMGDDVQAMKAGLVEMADVLVINKADCPGADALRAEMEVWAHPPDRLLCLASARSSEGIPEVVGAIEAADLRMRQSGRRAARRRKNWESEVVNWALEMMHGEILRRLNARERGGDMDPRSVAYGLVQEWCNVSENRRPSS